MPGTQAHAAGHHAAAVGCRSGSTSWSSCCWGCCSWSQGARTGEHTAVLVTLGAVLLLLALCSDGGARGVALDRSSPPPRAGPRRRRGAGAEPLGARPRPHPPDRGPRGVGGRDGLVGPPHRVAPSPVRRSRSRPGNRRKPKVPRLPGKTPAARAACPGCAASPGCAAPPPLVRAPAPLPPRPALRWPARRAGRSAGPETTAPASSAASSGRAAKAAMTSVRRRRLLRRLDALDRPTSLSEPPIAEPAVLSEAWLEGPRGRRGSCGRCSQ